MASLSIFLNNTLTHTHSFQFSPSQNLLELIPSYALRRPLVCCSSKKKTNFADQILDYIEGGPKLRKWYGAPDLLPKDGVLVDEGGPSEEEEIRDAVLVTNGDSEIGQMVILSLIVKRVRVKALVKDKRATVGAFGTYVEPIAGDASDRLFLTSALRGVRAIICPSNEGFLSGAGSMQGVQHIVLLSQLAVYRGSSGIQALMNSKTRKLAERDEAAVMASGIPYTIIRSGSLKNSPSGEEGFSFKEGSAAAGRLSKEDAAFICVEALETIPQKGIIFEVDNSTPCKAHKTDVVNGGEKVSDWKECFTSLISNAELIQ